MRRKCRGLEVLDGWRYSPKELDALEADNTKRLRHDVFLRWMSRVPEVDGSIVSKYGLP